MIDRMIAEMNKALDNGMYMAALSLAVSIPDACAKAEYHGKSNKDNRKRYIAWFNENIGRYENPHFKNDTEPLPYLSGEVAYSLRNHVLHQGTPNIDKNGIGEEQCKIDKLVLILEKNNQFNIYSDMAMRVNNSRIYELNLRRFCMLIELTAGGYYEENKDKFDFMKYELRFPTQEDENAYKIEDWRKKNEY